MLYKIDFGYDFNPAIQEGVDIPLYTFQLIDSSTTGAQRCNDENVVQTLNTTLYPTRYIDNAVKKYIEPDNCSCVIL